MPSSGDAEGAETSLQADVGAALQNALNAETNERARKQIKAILENVKSAGDNGLSICQNANTLIFCVHVGSRPTLILTLNRPCMLPFKRQLS